MDSTSDAGAAEPEAEAPLPPAIEEEKVAVSGESPCVDSSPASTRRASSQRKISVSVRIRPPTTNDSPEVFQAVGENMIVENGSKMGVPFDIVFGKEASNEEIFQKTCKELVDGCFRGFNSCLFTYGQTGSGKTHTMSGTPEDEGLVPRTIQYIFDLINANAEIECLLRVSYLEVYNENTYDLLTENKNAPRLREDKGDFIFVPDVVKRVVRTPEELNQARIQGEKIRHVGVSNMNAHSSRSHSLFRIHFETGKKNESGRVMYSTLNLVDLAGSETYQAGVTSSKRETKSINCSLLALQGVIDVLSTPKASASAAYIPYRDSVLTKILKTSLGGNSCTSIICTINPIESCTRETHSTLAFGGKARKVEVSVKANEDSSNESMLSQYRTHIAKLEEKLGQYEKVEEDKVFLESKYTLLQKEMEKIVQSMREQHALELELAEARGQIARAASAEELIDEIQALELENEISELSNLIGHLRQELSSAQDEKLRLHAQLQAGAEERMAAQRELEEWRSRLEDVQRNNSSVAEQLEAERGLALAARSEANQMSERLGALETERKELSKQLDEQSSARLSAENAVLELAAAAASLEQERAALRDEVEEQSRLRNAAEESIKDLSEKALQLEQLRSKLEEELHAEASTREAAEQAAAELAASAQKLQEEHAALAARLEEMHARRTELEAHLENAAQETRKVQEELRAMIELQSRQESEIQAIRDRCKKEEEVRLKSEEELQHHQALLFAAQEENQKLKSDQLVVEGVARMQFSELEDEKQRLVTLQKQYEDGINELQKQIEEQHNREEREREQRQRQQQQEQQNASQRLYSSPAASASRLNSPSSQIRPPYMNTTATSPQQPFMLRPPAAAAPSPHQVQQLFGEITALKKDKRELEQRLELAERAINRKNEDIDALAHEIAVLRQNELSYNLIEQEMREEIFDLRKQSLHHTTTRPN